MAAEVVTISEPASGASADVLVSLGFNCFRFTATPPVGPIEVLWAHPNFGSGSERPSGSGIPILFPFPGRIRGTTFEWEGRPYEQEPSDAFGNAIHGFVHKRPWRVIGQTANSVTGEFHASQDDASLKERWPADFCITATYSIVRGALKLEYTLENRGQEPLPCGFGVHPYFRLPIGGGVADHCLVRLPVAAEWELVNMLPTGRRIELANAAEFAKGRPFGELKLDNVFSGLAFNGRWCEASIHDPTSALTMTIRSSDAFREFVVYTPQHRQAICIEPYTCVPGPFELAQRGIDAGLLILQPGEEKRAVVEIAVA